MSNRDALRKLSQHIPPRPEVEKIINALRDQTDMSVVIIATAHLEAALEKLLISKFRTRKAQLLASLFRNRGPLSDFNGKILVAHAFQIVTTPMAEELHSLRTIRNTFAHAKLEVSFDHPLVAKELEALVMPKAMTAAMRDRNLAEKATRNRSRFMLSAHLLLIVLQEMETLPGTATQAIDHILSEQPQGEGETKA